MPHQPPQAQTFTVTVPDEMAARSVADDLAGRGHVLVTVREVDWAHRDPDSFWFGKPSMRPQEQGHWDVSSVATGPYPDDDEPWWEAQEEQAVRRLARHHGGRSSGAGGGRTSTILRVFTRVGLVHELDEATVEQRRLGALRAFPPRAVEPTPAAQPVEEDLADGPGRPVQLSGLSAVDWSGLEHAYGTADDVPQTLSGLAANDDRWDEHLEALVSSVTHQGSSYSATAPALRVVVDLALSPHLAPKRRLDLLSLLFLAASGLDEARAQGIAPGPFDEPVRVAVCTGADDLVSLWPTVSRSERRLILLIAAVPRLPVPDHDLADLGDPASLLAASSIRDEGEALDLLARLARSHEELIELAESAAPVHSVLVAALRAMLWQR